MTIKQRNTLLASMTDEVAAIRCCATTTSRTCCWATPAPRSYEMLPVHQRLIHHLESHADLDRGWNTSRRRRDRRPTGRRRGLTSPEFAVLVAYAKLDLKATLLATDAARRPVVRGHPRRLLPDPDPGRHAGQLDKHPLKREIIINSVVNSWSTGAA
jgi:glutamate dehydrogenase